MMRGTIQNKRVEISQEDAQQYLKLGKVAHVATVDEEGFPYVIPFVYVYEGENKLYLHIGNLRESHFWSNIKQNPKICIEVCDMGDLHPGKKYACQSALVYQSVVLFGHIERIEEETKKNGSLMCYWRSMASLNGHLKEKAIRLCRKLNYLK